MRIVQVVPRYAPAWAFGGGVRMFWLLANQLADRGHTIVAVTSDALSATERSPLTEEQIRPNVFVRRFRNPHNALSVRLGPLFFRPRGMRAGLREVIGDADVVHMGERALHNVWSADACARAGVPLVWSPYGGMATATGARGLYRRLLRLAFRRAVLPQVARFVVQTSHEEGACVRYGAPADRIRRIPLCIDWSSFQELPTRGLFRRKIGIPSHGDLVVSVARLHPAKGLDTLVRAFGMIPPSQRGPYLALVGWDDGMLRSLRSLAARLSLGSRVVFCEPRYGDERLTAYVDADVFALTPRYFEETSLAALEAAACGTPTVVTQQCEIPDLVAAGGGLMIEREESVISNDLQALLSDSKRRARMGRIARDYVSEHFTAERVARQHEQLFNEVTG